MSRFTDFFRRGETQNIDKMALWARGDAIGEPVWSGVTVTQDTALKLSVVWRCVRLISETLAGLPADAVRKIGERREPVARPPSWLELPNPELTWFAFAERVFESQTMDGNAFILITARDSSGFPVELVPLNPRLVQIRRDGDGPRSPKVETYFVWNGTTMLTRYSLVDPLGDVLHIPLATGGGIRGLSPIEAAAQSVGLGLVTEKFGGRFFGRGQQMSGVIQTPADVRLTADDVQVMREQWESAHSGSDRSHRPAILTRGATWQGITIPPEQAQFLETRAFQVEDIATRFYGLPAYLVGLTEKQTSWGTGVEQQGIGLVRYTLMGYILRFEQAMSQLLPRGQFLRLNPRALLRADSKTEAEILATELDRGVINFNEWRAILDLPPRAGGSRYMIPKNMGVLEPDGTPPAAPEVPSQPTDTPVDGSQP